MPVLIPYVCRFTLHVRFDLYLLFPVHEDVVPDRSRCCYIRFVGPGLLPFCYSMDTLFIWLRYVHLRPLDVDPYTTTFGRIYDLPNYLIVVVTIVDLLVTLPFNFGGRSVTLFTLPHTFCGPSLHLTPLRPTVLPILHLPVVVTFISLPRLLLVITVRC